MNTEQVHTSKYTRNYINNDYMNYLWLIYPNSTFKKIEPNKHLTPETIPNFNEYNYLVKYHYKIKQLKQIAKNYKLKLVGNKEELVLRIYSYLYLSWQSIKVQKIIRGKLQRKYNHCHGPAFKNRSLCTNHLDFFSMDELTTIPSAQFFSFKDQDGFIYGVDIMSLFNLINKSEGKVKNPFNQQLLSPMVIENFQTLLRLCRILKINILTEISDVTKEITDKKSVELRALSLFQNIDALGNYSNAQWFLTLNRIQLIKFIMELTDIWQYRANLTLEVKKNICHPTGNPFQRLPNLELVENIDEVRKALLEVMEKLVTTGIDKDNKCLGAYYVLGAITLVNNDASTSLPWLYEATYYM